MRLSTELKAAPVLGAVALLLAGMAHAATPVKPSDARLTSAWALAFERGNDIWVAHGDGSGERRVIANGHRPCWSPDKRSLAFERGDNVWVANADGSRQRPLTRHKAGVRSGKASASGSTPSGMEMSWNARYGLITFSHPEQLTLTLPGRRKSVRAEGCSIYDVHPSRPRVRRDYPGGSESPFAADNGLGVRFSALDTAPGFTFGSYEHPAWSHSGQYLAFACNGDLWIARGDSDDIVWGWTASRLASVADYDAANDRASRMNIGVSRISWSPDDRSIVYSLSRLNGSGWDEIRMITISPDNDPWRVVADIGLDDGQRVSRSPCFSPDGKLIAYHRYDTGEGPSIWVMSLGDRKARLLIRNASYPAW